MKILPKKSIAGNNCKLQKIEYLKNRHCGCVGGKLAKGQGKLEVKRKKETE